MRIQSTQFVHLIVGIGAHAERVNQNAQFMFNDAEISAAAKSLPARPNADLKVIDNRQ